MRDYKDITYISHGLNKRRSYSIMDLKEIKQGKKGKLDQLFKILDDTMRDIEISQKLQRKLLKDINCVVHTRTFYNHIHTRVSSREFEFHIENLEDFQIAKSKKFINRLIFMTEVHFREPHPVYETCKIYVSAYKTSPIEGFKESDIVEKKITVES